MPTLRIGLAAAALAAGMAASAQLRVYRTYEALESGDAKAYENAEFKKWKDDQNTTLIFKNAGKDDVEIACADIWGFTYKDYLFRVSNRASTSSRKAGSR